MREVYSWGAFAAGWLCRPCGREFEHNRHRKQLTFARFVVHKAIRHRSIPRQVTNETKVRILRAELRAMSRWHKVSRFTVEEVDRGSV